MRDGDHSFLIHSSRRVCHDKDSKVECTTLQPNCNPSWGMTNEEKGMEMGPKGMEQHILIENVGIGDITFVRRLKRVQAAPHTQKVSTHWEIPNSHGTLHQVVRIL